MPAVSSLISNTRVRKTLDWLIAHTDAVIADAITICEIPAPTFHELERAAWVADQFRRLGLVDVEIDAIGNVYGRRPGQTLTPHPPQPIPCGDLRGIRFAVPPGERGGQTPKERGSQGEGALLIAAHTDTVFPPGTAIQVRRANGRLYGPGLVDNSIAVASLLALAEGLDATGLTTQFDIWFVATVGEEGLGNLRGIRAAMERLGDQVAGVIALEGQGLGKVYNHAIGSRRYKITVRAPGGHSWGAFGNRSAIHELCKLGAAIAALDVPTEPKVTYNLGVISGGTSVNSIAEEAHCLLDMRSGDAAALDEIERRVMALAHAADSVPEVSVEATLLGDRPAGTISENHPLIRACFDALTAINAEAAGFPTRLTEGSTDANIPISLGIPATCIALTTGGGTHTQSEYMDPGPVRLGLQQLLLVALAVVGI